MKKARSRLKRGKIRTRSFRKPTRPQGVILRKRLLIMLFEKAFRYSEKPIFRLTSGRVSSYYIDCKRVTLDPYGAYLVGRLIFERIKRLKPEGIGGLTLGADPIAQAVSVMSHIGHRPIPAFVVRKEPKRHGLSAAGWIEGNLKKGSRVVVVDDVITTGGSTLKAIDRLRAHGCRILKVLSIVDRGEGGAAAIRSRGYTLEPLFDIEDFLGLIPSKKRIFGKPRESASRTPT